MVVKGHSVEQQRLHGDCSEEADVLAFVKAGMSRVGDNVRS